MKKNRGRKSRVRVPLKTTPEAIKNISKNHFRSNKIRLILNQKPFFVTLKPSKLITLKTYLFYFIKFDNATWELKTGKVCEKVHF
jgi:hypothetical protein